MTGELKLLLVNREVFGAQLRRETSSGRHRHPYSESKKYRALLRSLLTEVDAQLDAMVRRYEGGS